MKCVLAAGIFGWASCASSGLAQQLAFPEAEGFGRFATGARTSLSSASVYHVTNLNDSGAGSLRDAVSQSNRYVVFDVGGIINLKSALTFSSNLTIAGQTAPGGISLFDNRAAFHGANNLVARYFGVRVGRSQGRVDSASIVRGQNMMFDHMSITWGVDGTFDINPDSGQVIDNLTIQNSIVGQGLDVVGHSTGGLMTLGSGNRFSIIKSLFADNVTRNPKVRGENEFINNVVYGYETAGYIMGDTTATSNANVEGNYFIEGPVNGSSPFASGTSSFHIYAKDNWVDGDRDGVLDGTLNNTYPGADVVSVRHAFPTNASMSAQAAVQFVMDNVGLSITRDAVDARLVQEVASYGTLGGVILRETDLFPGYGTDAKYLNPRARLVDSDNDGMPDNWETAKGLNPNSAADFKSLVGGYTQLEQYLNELGGYNVTKSAAVAGGTFTSAATWGGAVPTVADTAVATNGITHASGTGFARQLTLNGTSSVSGGTLDVFDTALVGGTGNGSLTITGGTVSAGQVVLGAAGRSGSLNLTGGTLQTGTIASAGGTALLTLNGGTIRFTGVPNIAVPTTIGTAGTTLNTNGFSGTITGGLSGSGTISKTGAGTLTLGGNNAAYSGGINLTAGTIALATTASNSSTGAITASNGTTLSVTTSGAFTPLALASNATTTLTAGGLTYNGAITGGTNTTLVINNASTGTSNFSIGGNLAGFAGTFDLAASTGNIRIGSAGSALAGFDIGDSTGSLRSSNGGNVSLGSLAGGANTKLQGATADSTAVTWVVGGNNKSTTFGGVITDGVSTTAPGVTNLTKIGTGTLTLTNNAHTFTGQAAVNGGTLLINGSLANNAVVVQAGGTLGGSGGMKSLAVFAGGMLAPGNSIDSIEVAQTAAIAGLLNIELNGSGLGTTDLLSVGGELDLTNASLAFSIVPGGTAANDAVYVFATYGSLVSSFGVNIANLPAGYGIVYGYNNTKSIALVAGVPEPTILSAAGFVSLALLRRNRRLSSPEESASAGVTA